MRKERLIVHPSLAGVRLDRFLAEQIAGVSRKEIKRALDAGAVFVDGKVRRLAGYLLSGGEDVLVSLPGRRNPIPLPEVSVLFADEAVMAVNKPAGLPSHATKAGGPNALDQVRGLRPQSEPILLHRLDADTSGVLLFALTAEANRDMGEQFARREVSKVYWCLVGGTPPETFEVRNHLRAGVRGKTVPVKAGGQKAETSFRLMGTWGAYSLVEARPLTGRTHQIRAHLAGEGFPLLGDFLYGGVGGGWRGDEWIAASRHMLHARRLEFRHPLSGEAFCVEASLPDDFKRFLGDLS